MNDEAELSIDHPQFFHSAYAQVVREEAGKRKKRETDASDVGECSPLHRKSWVDYTELQDGFAIRNLQEARYWASRLLNPDGKIILEELQRAITCYQKHLHHLGPDRQFDTPRRGHILRMLQLLRDRPQLIKKIESLRLPGNPLSQRLIVDSLGGVHTEPLTNATMRQAVLSAFFTYLRQNVGSCFATAPAILILRDQPELFLTDIDDLLQINLLKRITDGKEFIAPISRTPGIGDLKRTFPLQRDNKRIWFSPGLIAAFQATGLLSQADPLKKKGDKLHQWGKKIFSQKELAFDDYMITPEQLIKRVLMAALELTPDEIFHYDNSLHPSHTQDTWLNLSSDASLPTALILPKSKDQRLKLFNGLFTQAKNGFVSVTDHPLLKTWEFTLASFAESRSDSTSWNVYACLGGETHHPHGIGEIIYKQIQEKLNQANNEVAYLDTQLEPLTVQLRHVEGRLNRSTSEEDAKWSKSEYQGLVTTVNSLQEERNLADQKGGVYTQLFPFLMNKFYATLPDWYQEVYDPDLHQANGNNPYDDSPAGFRLLQKNGRLNPLAWTPITNHNEYIDSLMRCLSSFEQAASEYDEIKPIRQEFPHLFAPVIQFMRTPEFIAAAFRRMAEEHQARVIEPIIDNMEAQPIKPWVYSSGGSMETLVRTYYKLSDRVTIQEKQVIDTEELLLLLLEFYKGLTYDQMKRYMADPGKGMLAFSPTHAFILLPGIPQFAAGWQLIHKNSYTWLRDTLRIPQKEWWERIMLTFEMQERLVALTAKELPSGVKEAFIYGINGALSGATLAVGSFRQEVLTAMRQKVNSNNFPENYLIEIFDSVCYRHLPMTNISDIIYNAKRIIDLLPDEISDRKEELIEKLDQRYPSNPRIYLITAEQLQNIIKGIILLTLGECFTSIDYHAAVCTAARRLDLASPEPLIFADTNWTRDLFAFITNPSTGNLQLWRCDHIGLHARPMQVWEHYLKGPETHCWGIYSKPYEYGQDS